MTGQQLRNSILQEAIQGRLVPNVLQPGEKTGAELLQDILAERQKKENQEKGKKAKKLSLSIIEEEPWELPEGWCWCSLDDLCHTIGSKYNQIKSTQIKETGQYPVVSQGQSLIDGYYDDNSKVVSFFPVIIFGDHTKNVKYIDFPFIVGADGTKILKPFNGIYEKWFYYVVLYFAKIVLYDRGYARHFSLLCKESFPLPPLSIQKAIVEKIEELFPVVDEYDKAAGELKALNEILPDKLRTSVLQEAIHGNLVPNEIPEGEATAQELLQQILKERQDRENKEKGKKAKKLSLSIIEEEPWELPEGWCWCSISDVGEVITGSTPSKEHPEYYGQDVPFFKPSDLDQGISVVEAHDYLSNMGYKFARQLPEQSVLVTCIGATIGKVGLIRRCGSCNQQINAIIPEAAIIPEYLFFCICSAYFQNEIKSNAAATTLPIINKNGFAALSLPIPPLSIQKAIVEKIKGVFSAIDKLK